MHDALMTYRRMRSGASVLALLIGTSLAAAPQAARAATVSCPDVQLLSEALARSASVFVGVVLTPFEGDAGRGGTLGVEETWRGPDLAPVVRVTIEDAAGAPTVDLARGVRYLVAADTPPDAAAADGLLDQVIVRACSVTRAWAPELADLRPADARVAESPTPTRTAGEPSVSGWLWAGSAALLVMALAAAGLAFTRRRSLLPVAAVLGVAGVALLGATIVLSLTPRGPVATGSPTPEPPMPTGSQEALPPDGRLVLRLEVMEADDRRSAVVSVHADGRLISAFGGGSVEVLREARLSTEGVRLVREAMDATGLLGPTAAADAEFVPQPRADGGSVPRGASRRFTFAADDGGSRTVRWIPIDPVDAGDFIDAPEIAQLEALAQQMLAPDDWLPASAWARAGQSDYRAETFHVLVRQIPFGSARRAIDVADLPAPLLAAIESLEPAAPATRCVQLARTQAAELLAMIAARLDQVGLTLAAASTDISANDSERSISYRVSLRPLLPDEGACPGEPAGEPTETETELAPGAIALVRVDALRVRSGPGSSFDAVDSFAAGDRVAVVAGPVAADGMNWYEVRQGPSGRGGHVAVGPADGNPWLVGIADGAIAFMEGDGSAGHSIGRMNADGSGIATLLDGGGPAWSPDGRRVAFTVLNPDGTWDLATASPDGSQVARLGVGEYPIWSPNGSMIAFGRGDEIWVMNADGTEQRLLVAGVSPWSASWDPDGSRLAYMAPEVTDAGGEGVVAHREALWFVDVDTDETVQVTPAEFLDGSTNPAWSPDGTLLTYGGSRLIDETGMAVLQLELGVTWGDARWAPNGNELAVLIDGTIEILEVASGERRPVARAGQANQLTWSPDGSHLAFTRSRAGSDGWQIHVVAAAGGEPVAIGPAFGQFPAWQPVVSHGLD